MGRVTQPVRVVRFEGGRRVTRPDRLAVEEPLELRVAGRPHAVTMRTPGHDIELAHGWLHAEGVIAAASDVRLAQYCAGSVLDDETGTGVNTYNVLDLQLGRGVAPPVPRAQYTSSACGVCGAESIDALSRQGRYDVASDPAVLDAAVLLALPGRLRAAQRTFDSTGGVHAAGLFTAAGERLVVREDVGRHNAVDKVVGWALLAGRLPLTGTVLQVSGRLSFELVQKAYLAGIPIVSAVSAPSSLAVDTASGLGVTVAGFVRGDSFNVYANAHRVTFPESNN
ncbi:formate dehydrogenase accessory sulfurtransferase FdhD [Micropruina sonneratiae]|uniref:formate dehydrogenase accessory sulfurtransferase FdhD n=1 Tax=Micropruina sonneratiae TaxID=2986940 RepID=UPI0022274149|nr:formate dehydrogenase accessory sulfurtransferase FdhD [Micropruina sp. KQZ13P-5]MCW3158708.1 formate dehydrogenase accessory sulfurtransferase FdhD [Micropruina sp. KQZ13P-5]